jgi:hypothetical protein
MSIYRYQPSITFGPDGTDLQPSYAEGAPLLLCTLGNYRYIYANQDVVIPDGIALEFVDLTPELRDELKAASPHVKLIDKRVIDRIRETYPIDDELYFARISVGSLLGAYTLLPGELEALQKYQVDVEAAREWGRLERAKLGL